MMSRPDAANSVASAVMAMVGEGLTRARRSARKAMISLSRELPTDPNARAGRCEDAAVREVLIDPGTLNWRFLPRSPILMRCSRRSMLRQPARMPDNMPSLPELIRRTATDDRAAFAALYAQVSPKLFGVALRICGRREVAEEVLQESFVTIWTRAKDYNPVRGSVLTWLVTIVRHCAIDQLRRQQSRPEGHAAPEELLQSFAAAGRTDSAAELRSLQRCLDELEPQPRHIVLLAYLYGLTREEIAGRLAMPVGTVKSSIWRSLDRLQRCLDP
ncbi:MAG TPA: sigma-70 family RNA polymerase sigma factor [Stellaceae bacterium]|nr:sigma-70 family RNA polymerase sigma factor [Stellaceae bacterium]